jgi:hypothetical protein
LTKLVIVVWEKYLHKEDVVIVEYLTIMVVVVVIRIILIREHLHKEDVVIVEYLTIMVVVVILE